MTPEEILDACSHGRCYGHGYGCDITPCRPCAERAIAAAVEAERARIEAVILRNVDAPWKLALIEDIREAARHVRAAAEYQEKRERER